MHTQLSLHINVACHDKKMNQPINQILRKVLTFIAILILTNLNGQDLNEHKWKNRVLIIQTSNELSNGYQNQLIEFINLDQEFKERKLVVYKIIRDKYKMTNYQNKKPDNSWKTSTKLYNNNLDEKDSFKVILIGLDGGIKLEQTTILKKEELFRIIDSMPMRMEELRIRSMNNESKNN